MKVKLARDVVEEVEIAFIRMVLPVRYGEEDIPNDFPFRQGEVLDISFTPEGQIMGWTKEHEEWFVKNQGHDFMEGLVFNLFMKVCDGGLYKIHDSGGNPCLVIEDDYVPHAIIPGDAGDYVELDISSTGEILNLELTPSSIQELFDSAAREG